MTESIDTTEHGAVRLLTISNPEKRNAFSGSMAKDLGSVLQAAEDDPAVRVVVISGEGIYAFSSGHDLNEVQANPETAADPEANAAFSLPARMQTPVIAAVNGAAYAAGFILAMNSDLRVAGDNASFGAVGARIGLVPVGGQLSRLLELVSYPVAFQLLATAAPMSAQEALQHSFVSDVGPAEDTVQRALSLARQIAEVSPAVVHAVKLGLSTTMCHGLEAGLSAETALAAQVQQRSDGDEGVRAFLERRKPSFADAGLLQSVAEEEHS